jgi:hypothetical protein
VLEEEPETPARRIDPSTVEPSSAGRDADEARSIHGDLAGGIDEERWPCVGRLGEHSARAEVLQDELECPPIVESDPYLLERAARLVARRAAL